jgi:hypothetical protein
MFIGFCTRAVYYFRLEIASEQKLACLRYEKELLPLVLSYLAHILNSARLLAAYNPSVSESTLVSYHVRGKSSERNPFSPLKCR